MKLLPIAWVERIFSKLQGVYGYGFTSKFATGLVNGTDAGIENAKQVWAEELGNFLDMPEAIAYALAHLPEKAPNVIEFAAIARHAPKKEQLALPHRLTEEDRAKAQEMASAAISATKAPDKFQGGIDFHWATHPRSALHMKFIMDAKSRDARFHKPFSEMVKDGICTQEGRLLKVYRNIVFMEYRP